MIKTILPFLYFNGNCQEALDFYSTVFKVPILERVTYREAEMEVDAHQKNYIMNATMAFGDMTISATDVVDNHPLTRGNTISIWLEIESEEAIKSIYEEFIDRNCKVITPLEPTFWGSIYAKVQDPFDYVWELNYQE